MQLLKANNKRTARFCWGLSLAFMYRYGSYECGDAYHGKVVPPSKTETYIQKTSRNILVIREAFPKVPEFWEMSFDRKIDKLRPKSISCRADLKMCYGIIHEQNERTQIIKDAFVKARATFNKKSLMDQLLNKMWDANGTIRGNIGRTLKRTKKIKENLQHMNNATLVTNIAVITSSFASIAKALASRPGSQSEPTQWKKKSPQLLT